jgi:hypothetical protein
MNTALSGFQAFAYLDPRHATTFSAIKSSTFNGFDYGRLPGHPRNLLALATRCRCRQHPKNKERCEKPAVGSDTPRLVRLQKRREDTNTLPCSVSVRATHLVGVVLSMLGGLKPKKSPA